MTRRTATLSRIFPQPDGQRATLATIHHGRLKGSSRFRPLWRSVATLANSRVCSCPADIYGDDDNEFEVQVQDDENTQDKQQPESQKTASATDLALPARPLSPNSAAAAALSYSAQIAQQFSAYQQTPSQERQQRSAIPLPQNPRPSTSTSTAGPAIPTFESTDSPDASVFGKKPSEMHDDG